MAADLLAVSGFKNSGKTTLIEAILPHLTAAGLKVAVIKHDGHDFDPGLPGTDDHRHRQAGACATALYSPHRWTVACTGAVTPEVLLPLFPDADLVLLEGGKGSPYPKLALTRNREVAWHPANVLAWVDEGYDPAALAALILDWRCHRHD